MPIYEYRCDDCGLQKEFLQKLSDAPISACPTCRKSNFRKLLSAAGFQLKGSGWYQTDFKSSGSKPKDSDSKSKDSDSKPKEKESEAAPAAAPTCAAAPGPAQPASQ